jgi:hypothetical protein
MWTPAIVEQDYLLTGPGIHTSVKNDPTKFTCMVHCQTTFPVLDEIAIKVPGSKTATSLFLNKYTISLEKNQYLHGVTRRCLYI